MINELAKQIHQNARDKGFFEKEKNIGEMLMLIVTEVAEACEADRNSNYYKGDINAVLGNAPFPWEDDESYKIVFESCGIKNSFQDEMADVIIRVLDLCAYKNINIEQHIKAKMRYNSLREKYHGKNY